MKQAGYLALSKELLTAIGSVIVAVLIIGAVMYGCGSLKKLVEAPLKRELEASRGNQAAAKKSVEHQNEAVGKREAEGKVRKEASRKAVAEAGKPEFKRAEDIQKKPAPGATPLDRAMNRIDTELGLQ